MPIGTIIKDIGAGAGSRTFVWPWGDELGWRRPLLLPQPHEQPAEPLAFGEFRQYGSGDSGHRCVRLHGPFDQYGPTGVSVLDGLGLDPADDLPVQGDRHRLQVAGPRIGPPFHCLLVVQFEVLGVALRSRHCGGAKDFCLGGVPAPGRSPRLRKSAWATAPVASSTARSSTSFGPRSSTHAQRCRRSHVRS